MLDTILEQRPGKLGEVVFKVLLSFLEIDRPPHVLSSFGRINVYAPSETKIVNRRLPFR